MSVLPCISCLAVNNCCASLPHVCAAFVVAEWDALGGAPCTTSRETALACLQVC